jgi:general secretion pathway protein G
VNYLRADDGYTLVELICVVAIIAILAAIAIPSYSAYITNVRNKRCMAEMHMLEQEITLYNDDNGHLPDTLADIGRDTLMDPWGHQYQYLNIADGGVKGKGKLRRDKNINPLNSDYDLFSMGKNGTFKKQLDAVESKDDIVRAYDGAFLDLAAKFEQEY